MKWGSETSLTQLKIEGFVNDSFTLIALAFVYDCIDHHTGHVANAVGY